MRSTWRGELVQLAPIALMFASAAFCWSRVPDRIPTHWNIHGEADGFGGRFAGLLLFPILAFGIYLLMLALPRFDPGRINYKSFGTAYSTIRLAISLFLAAFEAVVLMIALGYPVNVNVAIGLAIGVMFIVMGNVMGKIRPNWFVGIRTPWTLSSKLSWNKTHRLGGWLFMAMGVVALAWSLVPTPWMFAAMMAFDTACVAWMVVYSYRVYRADPARTLPAGTSAADEP